MSTIINADTSDGLKFTSDTSGEVKIQSAGADIVTVNSTGITMAAGKTLPASALTGSLPAIDGSSLTNLPQPAALTTASGSAPSYSARAWVNFNGTGTVAIRASGNVSSITDYGTGDYGVNFTTAMPDADYSVAGAIKRNTGNINDRGYMYMNPIHTPSTTAVRIATNDQGQMLDMEWVTPMIVR